MKRWKKRALGTAAAALGLILIVMALAPLFALPRFWGRRYEQNRHDPAEFGVEAVELTLLTDDGLALASWFVQAGGGADAKGTVIILSGLQSPSVTVFFGYAKLFAGHGYNSLLVEMRARGLSQGKEIGFGMTEWRDVKAAADYLEGMGLPIVVMGTSMGAGAAIIAAAEVETIDAVIAASPPSSAQDMFVSYMDTMGVPRFAGGMEMPFVTLYLGLHYGFDALRYSPEKAMAGLHGRPVLLMQSTGDTQVPFWEHEKLLGAALENGVTVQTFIREGDWHFICYDEDVFTPWEDTEFAGAVFEFLDGLP